MKNRIPADYFNADLGRGSDLDEINRAIEFYTQELSVARVGGNRDDEAIALNKLGDAYSELGDIQPAIEFFEQALIIVRDKGERKLEAALQGKMGLVYMKSGEIFLALKCFGEVIGIAKTIGDRKMEGIAFLNTSMAFMIMNSRGPAIKHAQTALYIFEEIEDAEEAAMARGLLSRLRSQSANQKAKKWWQFWKTD